MLQLKQRMAQVCAFPVVLDPAWKFALITYLIARLALTAWSLVIVSLFPIVLKNLDLFGAPVLAAFDLASSERYVYSRQVADPATSARADGVTLTFRAGERGYVVDTQTESVWSLREGRAVAGEYAGRALNASIYSAEDVFPYRGVAPSQNIFLAPWQRFDTNWYLEIAQRGYSADDGSTVYFPLYPSLIRVIGSLLLGRDLLAALIISNSALVGVFYLLYRFVNDSDGEDAAKRTLGYQVIFPSAFFLFAAYTESLFLLLALASLREGTKARWGRAGVYGALAALTRLQGVLLIVPLGYLWWKTVAHRLFVSRKGSAAEVGALFSILFTSMAFLILTRLSLLTRLESQWQARFVWPWETMLASIAWLEGGQGTFVDVLNLGIALLFGITLFSVWKKLPREYFLYAFVMFAWPFFRLTPTQPLVSMTRYMLPIFPVFFVWAAWGKSKWANRAIVYLSFPLQLYLSAQFVMWGWVG